MEGGDWGGRSRGEFLSREATVKPGNNKTAFFLSVERIKILTAVYKTRSYFWPSCVAKLKSWKRYFGANTIRANTHPKARATLVTPHSGLEGQKHS